MKTKWDRVAVMAEDPQMRHDLIARLRGCYTVPVNAGAGTLNGSTTFTRMFDVPPINLEAADEIERLSGALTVQGEIAWHIARTHSLDTGRCSRCGLIYPLHAESCEHYEYAATVGVVSPLNRGHA